MRPRAKLKTFLRAGIAVALVIGIGIQFVPVEGLGDNPSERHDPEAPVEAKAILRESCMDCHSHETRWPWYARLAPGSWLMARDVRRARAHFNISEWGGLEESYRQVDKENAWEQIKEGNMPPRRYLMLHPGARLSDQEKEIFRRWLLAGKQPGRGFAAEANKCTIATKGDSPVAQACAKGGVKLAKATMKQLVKTAKDNGVKFDCDSCHKNDETFELAGDAREKFKRLLAVQTK